MNNPNLPSGRKSWLASSINEIAVSLWTCMSFHIMYVTKASSEILLIFPLIAGAIGFVWMTNNKPVVAKVDPLLSFSVFLLLFSILASYLFNAEKYDLIFMFGNVVSTVLLFISLYAITTKIDLDLRKVLVFQYILVAPILPLVLATAKNQWGRIMPADLEANYVCMMAMLCFVGACSVRSWFWVLLLSALPLYTIVVMQSRDSLLAVCITILIVGFYHLRRIGWTRLRPYLVASVLGGPIVCIGLYFVGIDVFGYASNVFESLFMLNDQYRGIDSGGSGRTELWSAAINLWISHPIFGVGFKGHPFLMQEYSHSAYLGMLADVGVVGFVAYMLIVGVALYRTLSRGERGLPEFPQRAAILISYLVYGLLESRAFSFGNSYSLLFLLVAFDSSKVRVNDAPAPEVPRAKPSSPVRQPVPVNGAVPWRPTAR